MAPKIANMSQGSLQWHPLDLKSLQKTIVFGPLLSPFIFTKHLAIVFLAQASKKAFSTLLARKPKRCQFDRSSSNPILTDAQVCDSLICQSLYSNTSAALRMSYHLSVASYECHASAYPKIHWQYSRYLLVLAS